MLVLSRKHGERIHIGEDIFIEVRRVAGNRVTLAVNAPRDLRVLRGELLEAVKSFEPSEPVESDKTSESAKPENIVATQKAIAPTEHLPSPTPNYSGDSAFTV